MDRFWGLTQTGWTAVAALAAGATLVVAVVAALYARRQILIAHQQNEDNRNAAIEADRPYVIVSLESGETSRHFVDLIVRNIGRRPALEVRISLDPAPIRANEVRGAELAKMRLLNEPIAQIAPGQELRAFFDSQIERADKPDLPTAHTASLNYRDSAGREYTESAVVDVAALKGVMYSEVYTIHHAATQLKEIATILKKSGPLNGATLSVDAAVEPRQAREERRQQAASERRAKHQSLVARMLPGEGLGANDVDVEPDDTEQG
jgi:hypothetical protein